MRQKVCNSREIRYQQPTTYSFWPCFPFVLIPHHFLMDQAIPDFWMILGCNHRQPGLLMADMPGNVTIHPSAYSWFYCKSQSNKVGWTGGGWANCHWNNWEHEEYNNFSTSKRSKLYKSHCVRRGFLLMARWKTSFAYTPFGSVVIW